MRNSSLRRIFELTSKKEAKNTWDKDEDRKTGHAFSSNLLVREDIWIRLTKDTQKSISIVQE